MCFHYQDSHLAGYEYEKWDFMRRELLEVTALASVPDQIFQQGEDMSVKEIVSQDQPELNRPTKFGQK